MVLVHLAVLAVLEDLRQKNLVLDYPEVLCFLVVQSVPVVLYCLEVQ
jgi:hypothetical protein